MMLSSAAKSASNLILYNPLWRGRGNTLLRSPLTRTLRLSNAFQLLMVSQLKLIRDDFHP